ncbi:ABC-three component system middle component 1 [Escherichia coli]|uniref:ABC-three component system middle component 1 n=1 Tax=Escherichia coli TaxID=562 RepID=UPI0038B57E18
MNLLNKEFDLEFLKSRFSDADFYFFVSNDDSSYISCVACYCESANYVVANWTAVQNYLSAYYQPKDELALWNIYLVFFCSEKLPIWDKYLIDNDKYSVRKLIIDGLTTLPSISETVTFLNNHLLGADLELTEIEEKKEIELSLIEYISGTPLDSKVESRDERMSRIDKIINLVSSNKNENKKS